MTRLGRTITAVQIPLERFASQLPEGPFRDGMRLMMAHYDKHGLPGGNPLVVRAILGREPRSLKDYFANWLLAESQAIARSRYSCSLELSVFG
jgi:hypothetical protein